MSYLPRTLSLDEEGKNRGRSEHSLIKDRYASEEWFSGSPEESLDDDEIYMLEIPYFYTSRNTNRSQVKDIGDMRGDLDAARLDLSEDKLYLTEIKGVKRVPEDMPEEERKQRYDMVRDGHEQLSDAVEAIRNVELAEDVDIEVETEVLVWMDVFDSENQVQGEIPLYEGSHILNENAYETAMESEVYHALNDGMFDGKMLEPGERIRER